MMKKLQCYLWGMCFLLFHFTVNAQSTTVTGTVTAASDNSALPGVSVVVKGTTRGTATGVDGAYTISATPTDVLVFRFIGMQTVERTVGTNTAINIALKADSKNLNEVVVTALGIKQEKKALGYAVTEVKGATIAQTQRENFVNGLAGRVAGVEVNASSGLPGSSSSIVIRGISSLSGSNQPLFVVDGLPISNNTTSTGVFASSIGGGSRSFENRGVDFTNRAADINPEDIESITVLKGPEAAALYGIEAASGAIVITTKRGQAGKARINYSNSFRMDRIVRYPEIQQKYDRGANGYTIEGDENLAYFGAPFPSEVQFYDNVKNFFQDAFTQKHNLSFTGGNESAQYRISGSYTDAEGFIPNTGLEKLTLSSAITAKLNKFLSTDVTFDYTRSDNDQAFRGAGGPLLQLLRWPSNDDASVYLTPSGNRRDFGAYSIAIENPFFNVNKNIFNSLTDRYRLNTSLTADVTDWMKLVGQAGIDYYTEKNTIVRHPESNAGRSFGGIFDQAVITNRNLTFQYYAQFTAPTFFNDKLRTDLKLGSTVYDWNTFSSAASGEQFMAPDLYSINNTTLTTQRAYNNLTQRRLVGAWGSFNASYNDMLYLTLTGRNDWTSTLPVQNNSFFYPSAAMSFVFTELEPFQGIREVLSFGKLRGSIAQVGKDARPYSLRPFYESAQTTGGGFRYGFTGPSLNLRPEMTTSYEFGTELKFFNDRLGIDATYFKKKSVDQIVQNLRLSYATGFILMTFNAGEMENSGIELQLNGTPIQNNDFTWDVLMNYTKNNSKLTKLPGDVQEFYNSDTWLYGNVRVGSRVDGPLTTFTGYDYQRNDNGDVLINPSTGLPMLNTSEWKIVGDRNPDFNIGLTNTFTYKNLSLNFLLDIRKGGDVYNATEHFLTVNGLSKRTLNREEPRIVTGVLKDGLENTANPTHNNIPIDLYRNSTYWASIYPHHSFIEKDVNWVRLRDVTLNYRLPASVMQRAKFIDDVSVFVTGTDLFLLTNYSGLDPVANGNSAAVGGAGGTGLDYGNFPLPRGINFGIRAGF
ncbi:SusC/RagA family TonB-linked outer membrane protein [Pontibacter sp. JH31]|uniref:SusC/RagA family TonB-linked outer membrane protein n=1 Tax=Pontibacter aquaedesilientis TaxID=2766980 RepID=A0ABR7XGW7_9BACT|nr:SusC/RagA family TonB-linked outer membrane protein [Pontibacter aquaedesilientis]MBD1396641.1 SusC/RagA family TonB-linked outer membrane protein [Pontibacter aquaedesilientis]